MNRTAATLRQVGEALFGPTWQTSLAAELGLADRTVRRMVAGDRDIPAGVWDDIANLCRARAGALAGWADKLGTPPKRA